MKARHSSPVIKELLAPRTRLWTLASVALGFLAFRYFAGLSRYAFMERVQFENLISAAVFAVSFALVAQGTGLFDRENRFARMEVLVRGLVTGLLSMAVTSLILQFAFFIQVGRLSMLYGSLGAIAVNQLFLILVGRLLAQRPMRFLILGPETSVTRELISSFRKDHIRRHLQLAADAREYWLQNLDAIPLDRVKEILDSQEIADVVLTDAVPADSKTFRVALRAMRVGCRVVDENHFYAEVFRRYPGLALSPSWLSKAGFDSHKPYTNLLKRIFDLLLSFILLVLGAPFMFLIALIVKVSSPGPVFFFQERVGRSQQTFRMIKFRSMQVHDPIQGDQVTKQRDSRVTKIGKIIRPLHLDELPQLWNILRGDMSFVGPRPALSSLSREMSERSPGFELRQMLRPGLTGLAQISQGYSLDTPEELDQKLGYDLYYLRNYGLVLDLWILYRTAFVLAKRAW